MLKTVAITSGGNGTVTQVGGTGTVNGITLTGNVTTTGNLTLGGTLDLSSPPAIGGTTAAAGSFSTLNSSGNTRLGGLSGNQSLQVNNVASAVDYLQVSGNSGGYPSLSAQGASTNVSIVYGTKGTGGHNFTTNGLSVNQFVITNTASAVNYAQFTGATTGSPVIMLAQGSDTNISLAYSSKGTGRHTFFSNSGTQFVVGNTASAVNYAQTDGAATGAAPTISAAGSDANIGLVLTGKGTGVVALGGSTVANSAAQFVPSTSGVNFLQFTGGATGVSPSFVSSGTDAAVGFNISTKGNANIALYTNNFGNFSFIVKNVASAVNYIQTQGAVTTGAPELSAQGSDTNINLKLTTKGTGTVQYGTYTAGVVAQAGYITITDAGGTSRRLLVG